MGGNEVGLKEGDMEDQMEFKEEVFVVSIRRGIEPVYLFSGGQIMGRKDYDEEAWKGLHNYLKEDFYWFLFGDDCCIDVQQKIAKTYEEAEQILKDLRLKQIVEKERELVELRNKVGGMGGKVSRGTETVEISKDQLFLLKCCELELVRLEAGGVDNWEWYEESLNPEGLSSLEEEKKIIKKKIWDWDPSKNGVYNLE